MLLNSFECKKKDPKRAGGGWGGLVSLQPKKKDVQRGGCSV